MQALPPLPPPPQWCWPFSSPRGRGLCQEGLQSMPGCADVCLAPSTAPLGSERSWGRSSLAEESPQSSRAAQRARRGGPHITPVEYSILALNTSFPKRPLGTPGRGHLYELFSKAIAIARTKKHPRFPLPADGPLCRQEPWSALFRTGTSKLACTEVKSEKYIGPNF